jgi:hypothetical protein
VSFDVPQFTANTFLNPDLNLSGDACQSFTGARRSTLIRSLPIQRHRNTFYGVYVHDFRSRNGSR